MTATNPDAITTTEVECTLRDWTQPTSRHAHYGTRERPPVADYAAAVMTRISAHIDTTGHPVRATITTYRPDGNDEKSSALLGPHVGDAQRAADLLARLSPATRGLRDVWWGSHRGYLGGPLDGQPVTPGYQGLRRDETGRPLRATKTTPAHYVLHTANAEHTRAYVHTSLLEPGR